MREMLRQGEAEVEILRERVMAQRAARAAREAAKEAAKNQNNWLSTSLKTKSLYFSIE